MPSPLFLCYTVLVLLGTVLLASSRWGDRRDTSGRTTSPSASLLARRTRNGTIRWGTGRYHRVSFRRRRSGRRGSSGARLGLSGLFLLVVFLNAALFGAICVSSSYLYLRVEGLVMLVQLLQYQ